jgi:hypothetical protein
VRTYFMDVAAVRPTPDVLVIGNDRAAPRTNLSRGTEFIVFRIEAIKLPGLTFALLELALPHVLPGQHGCRGAFDTRLVSSQEFFFTIFRRDSHAAAPFVYEKAMVLHHALGSLRTAPHYEGRSGTDTNEAEVCDPTETGDQTSDPHGRD